MIIYCHIRDFEVLFRFHSKEIVRVVQVANMEHYQTRKFLQ